MPGLCAPSLNRRKFVAEIGAIATVGSFPAPVVAQGRPRLVVVGGGAGGATVAKCVARDANGAINVTLVEPLRQFTTCFPSNLYLGGVRGWDTLIHSYDALASRYGVTLVHQASEAIDREKKTVRSEAGNRQEH